MKLSLTAKRMFSVIGASALLFIAAAAIFYRSPEVFPFAAGVLVMSALNCAKVLILEKVVEHAANMDDAARGKSFIRFQYFLRLVLTGAVLVGAGLLHETYPSLLWGAAIGILGFQIAAHSLQVFMRRDIKREEAEKAGETQPEIIESPESPSPES